MEASVGDTTLRLSARVVALALLALGVAAVGGYDYLRGSQAVTGAVAVQATVTEAGVEAVGRGDDRYVPAVEYTYRYDGTRYTGDRVFPEPTIPSYRDRATALATVEPYDPGATVRAYVPPSAPGDAFLVKRRPPPPYAAVGLGALGLVVAVLAGLGTPTPGRATPRPAEAVADREPTWFDRHGESLRRLAVGTVVACFVVFWLALLALVGVVLTTDAPRSATRGGLPVVVAALALVGEVVGLCLYAGWSFGAYRRLRRRLPAPRPPSPFRHPARLVTVLGTDHETLSVYGRRVRLTGLAGLAAVALTVLAVQVFVRSL
jgi:hypothetical protein